MDCCINPDKRPRVLEAVEAAASVLELDLTFNTSYLTDSYIVFTLKMESVSKNTIFGLKMREDK